MKMNLQIVPRRNPHAFEVLPRRWVVERTFAWISKHRRTVRDYERLPASHEAMILWAMTALMACRLAQPSRFTKHSLRGRNSRAVRTSRTRRQRPRRPPSRHRRTDRGRPAGAGDLAIREARTTFEITEYPKLLDQLAASAQPSRPRPMEPRPARSPP